MFTFYINGIETGQPRDFENYEQEVQRDVKTRFLYQSFPGSFTITNASGYPVLRELFVSGTCNTATYQAFQTCAGKR